MNEFYFDKLAEMFAAGDLKGSYSVKTGERGEEPEFLFSGREMERELHREIYLLDPEYEFVTAVCAYKPRCDGLPEISLGESLEEAVLTKGIAHTRDFYHNDFGKLVRFGKVNQKLNPAKNGG